MSVYKTILDCKIVAIIRGLPVDTAVKLAQTYVANGIRCVEITFDQTNEEKQRDTLCTIRRIRAALGEAVCVGAGTVMTAQQVTMAAEAGAQYIISPNVDEEVIVQTKKLGLISIPGAMTPSEIATGYKLGADIIKLFPANELGLSYIKAVKAPLKHIPIMATGGVRPHNAADYLTAGSAALGVAGDLVNKQWIAAGDWDKIGQTAAAYVAAINKDAVG